MVVKKHPLTGDELSRNERASWIAQSIIRRWSFIISISIGSFIWWYFHDKFGDPDLSHWNAWASWMALVIESIVGIAMFGQTQRDAVILREIRALAKKLENNQNAEIQMEHQELDMLKKLLKEDEK